MLVCLRRMFIPGLLIISCLFLPLTGSALASQKRQLSYKSISFLYDASLATGVVAQTVPDQK